MQGGGVKYWARDVSCKGERPIFPRLEGPRGLTFIHGSLKTAGQGIRKNRRKTGVKQGKFGGQRQLHFRQIDQ